MASEINLRCNALPIFCPSLFCYRLVLYNKVYFQILLMASKLQVYRTEPFNEKIAVGG